MTKIVISRFLLDKMISHCRSVYPHEACGLLAGRERVVEKIYEMTNADRSNVSYMMDPTEQFHAMKEMRLEGNRMIAIYHSHPHSPAYPSAKDVDLAFYSDSLYVILGLNAYQKPEVRAFQIVEGTVREGMIEVEDL
jgi:proteasome lid subunit RPN8/RPN11